MTLSEGLQLFRDGKYDEASEKILEVVQNDENNHKAWNALGVVLSKTGQKDDAQSCFENAVQLDPDNETYKKNLEKILNNKGNKAKPTINHPKKETIEQKNPLIPLLLSIIFPGFGQVYNGMGGVAGLVRGIGTIIGYFIFVIPGLIIHLYLIHDAYKTRCKMNNNEIEPSSATNTDYLIFSPVIIIVAIAILVILSAIIAAFVFGVSSSTPKSPIAQGSSVSPVGTKSTSDSLTNIVYQQMFKDNIEVPHSEGDIEFYGAFGDMYNELAVLDGKSMQLILGVKSWNADVLNRLDQIGQEKASTINKYVTKIQSLKISNDLYPLREKIIKDVTMQSDCTKYLHQAYLYAQNGDLDNTQLTMAQYNYAVSEQVKYQKDVVHTDPIMYKVLQANANMVP